MDGVVLPGDKDPLRSVEAPGAARYDPFDSTGAHSFTAIGLRTNPSNIYYDKRYELVRKVSRAECYKLLKEFSFGFSKESWKRYNEDPVNNHRPAVKHIFYVPHELDCEVDVK